MTHISSDNADSDSPAWRNGFGDLTRRVLGWMLLVSLLPLVIMAAQGYHCGMQAVMDKTHDQLMSLLDSRRALVETWVNQRYSELDILATSPSVARCCSHFAQLTEAEIDAEVTAMIRGIVTRVDAYDSITVFDGDDNVIATTRHPEIQGSLPAIPEKNPALKEGEFTWFGVPQLSQDNSTIVPMFRLLRNPHGDKIGAISANLNLTRSLEPLLLEPIVKYKRPGAYLITANKTILAGTSALSARPHRRMPQADYLPDAFLSSGYHDYRDATNWRAAEAVARTPWTLVVELNFIEATQWLRILLHRTVITGSITLIVLVFLALWISRRLGQPLRQLALVAQRISAGNVDERVPELNGSEAEAVRRAVNQMLDELKEKQAQVVRTAALASVGELSTSIVHEMRNPLSSIKMNIQGLRHDLEQIPSGRELADIAEAQAKRLEGMLDDLLQYGRPISVNRQPKRFRELADAAIAVVQDQARAKHVHIAVDDQLLKTRLDVDPELMCRALTNLLANAIQASPEDSTVTLGGWREALWSEKASISVQDSGPGLNEEIADRIFKPFFTTKPNGAGLGLANVRKIVDLHGGSVTAANLDSGGAVFTITLPVHREDT
ncbi:MAG: sensor histidine kinase [Candidatus Hydrogenedentes bacterium]|nr:sensor histidine kinase [Candidatus Hydrogenedentota bacterium]